MHNNWICPFFLIEHYSWPIWHVQNQKQFYEPYFSSPRTFAHNLHKFIWTTLEIVNLSYMEYTMLMLNDNVVVSINTSKCSNFVFLWWCSWCCHRMHRWKGRDLIYSQLDYQLIHYYMFVIPQFFGEGTPHKQRDLDSLPHGEAFVVRRRFLCHKLEASPTSTSKNKSTTIE